MARDAEVSELLETSDFDSAFDSFIAAGDPAAGADEGEKATAEAEKAAAEAAAVEAEKAEAEKAAAEAAEAEKVAAEKAAAEAAAKTEPKPVTAAEIGAAVAAALKPAEPAKEAPAPEPEDSPEVKAALADMEKEWPTIGVAVAALLEKQEKKVRAEVKAEFEELLKPLKAQLEPAVAAAQITAEAQFRTALIAEHADAYTIIPDVEKWIEQQPAYLQPAYNHVLDHGSAADVAKLLTDYKAVTGKLTPAADEKAAQEAAAKAAKAAADAERLAKMETPSGVRTSVTAEPDPNDFDSAWTAAASKAA